MPYISRETRFQLEDSIEDLITSLNKEDWNAGIVNYIFTKILIAWWRAFPKYITICEIMGTLSCVGQEFYRRIASHYEDLKISDNGDVY